jgi:hypothetical protein
MQGINVDVIMQLITAFVFIYFIIVFSTVFESEYPDTLVDLHNRPWWRLIIIFFVISASIWNPTIGIVAGTVVFFYLADLNILSQPLIS